MKIHQRIKTNYFSLINSIYGVRRYLNGSSLGLHLDTAATHVISAIMQIDQVQLLLECNINTLMC
jgi:hypothetical protein